MCNLISVSLYCLKLKVTITLIIKVDQIFVILFVTRLVAGFTNSYKAVASSQAGQALA